MYRMIVVLMSVSLMAGCGFIKDVQNAIKEGTSSTDENLEKEAEKVIDSKDKPPVVKDETNVNNSPDLTIPTVDIDSPFGEDGNYHYTHSEQEIVEEYMDESGRIYFALDDHPIRSITSADKNMTYATNYHDAYIDQLEQKAYVLPEDQTQRAYDLFILNPPEELKEKDPSDYRSWDDATNLERGIIQMITLMMPLFGDLDVLIENEMYDAEEMEIVLSEFEKLGNPNVFIPAPQSAIDLQLFENMQMIQELWGRLGNFENPQENKEEFEKIYQTLRQETNNIFVRVNYTLSEEL